MFFYEEAMALAGIQVKRGFWHQLFKYSGILSGYQMVVIAGHDQGGRCDMAQPVHGVMCQAGVELTKKSVWRLDMAQGNFHKLLNMLRLMGDELMAEINVHILVQNFFIVQPFVGHISASRFLAHENRFSAPAGRAAQNQALDQVGAIDGQFLGDVAAHGNAQHVGLFDTQSIHETCRIIREHGD